MILMEKIILNIAGFNIEVCFFENDVGYPVKQMKKQLIKYLNGFIIKKKHAKISYRVKFIKKDTSKIIYKKKEGEYYINFYHRDGKKSIVTYYVISYFQFQIILRTILFELLAEAQGFMLHASAANIVRKANLFFGKSGVGKSTAAALIIAKYPTLADDCVIIKKEGSKFYFYQTPFLETHEVSNKKNERMEIGKLYFLKKSAIFKIEKIPEKKFAVSQLFNQFWSGQQYLGGQMKYLLEFADKHDFYYLYFAKDKYKLLNLITKVTRSI